MNDCSTCPLVNELLINRRLLKSIEHGQKTIVKNLDLGAVLLSEKELKAQAQTASKDTQTQAQAILK